MTALNRLTLLGYDGEGNPIYWVAGGSGPIVVEADDGDDDQDDSDDADLDDDDTPPAEPRGRKPDGWKPPTREEWQRQQDAIRRNNRENTKLRQIKKELTALGISDLNAWLLERGIDPKTGGRLGEDDSTGDQDQPPPEPDRRTDQTLARRLREAEREVARTELKWKPALVKAAAEASLRSNGWTGKDLSRVMRLIEVDDVDVDADGNVTGLDEQISELKDEFPEWFRKSRRGRSSGSDDGDGDGDVSPRQPTRPGKGTRLVGGGNQQTAPEAKSWLEILNEQMS